jgi:UDP-3-O-[3-hydroxymyristoyl] glucosamine N-acyltransferase
MRLSSLTSHYPADLIRDAEFLSMGLVTHQYPQMLTFVEHLKYLSKVLESQASALIISEDLLPFVPDNYGVLVSDNPRLLFFKFHNYLALNTEFYWSSFPSKISHRAKIHPKAYVAEKDVIIEDDVVIEPGAVILERSVIGAESTIRAGATIGAEGFEFKRFGENILHLEHGGGARLGRRVEIQSNSNVDRSVYGHYTEVGDETKIDTLVHIGHHAIIGRRVFIAAQTVISGSSVIEDDVWIGPGSTISSEITIGEGAHITLGSVVTKDVSPGERVTGNFAIDHKKFIEFMKSIR